MIAEIWTGRVSAGHREAITTQLQATIQARIKSTCDCRGAYVLQRAIADDQIEIMVLTLFEARRNPSRSPVENGESLLAGFEGTLTRHEVITDPPRTLLYAELSRRFPLRSMAPR